MFFFCCSQHFLSEISGSNNGVEKKRYGFGKWIRENSVRSKILQIYSNLSSIMVALGINYRINPNWVSSKTNDNYAFLQCSYNLQLMLAIHYPEDCFSSYLLTYLLDYLVTYLVT